MNESEALAELVRLVINGRVAYTNHALDEMYEAGANEADVKHALLHATSARHQPSSDRWRIDGPDIDGDSLTVVVYLEAGVVIITVF